MGKRPVIAKNEKTEVIERKKPPIAREQG